jgi:hypothetical protein
VAIMPTMPSSVPRRRIVIEFEPGLAQVAGTISAPPEPDREFCGWLELISRLDLEFNGGGPPEGDSVGWLPDADPRPD